MIAVYLVSKNIDDIRQVEEFIDGQVQFFGYYTYELFPSRRAYRLLKRYHTKKCPFAVILDDNKVIRSFYSQNEDVINNLCEYLIDHRIIEK